MKVQDATTKNVVIPGQVLQSLIQRQMSGTMTIYDPLDESVFWQLYFGGGKLHFATSGMGKRERLTYLLGQLFPKAKFPMGDSFSQDYDYICQIWKAGKLSLQQVRQVLFFTTQEAIAQFLSLPRAAIKFERALNLDPLLLSLSLKEMVRPIQPTVRQWVQLRPEIASPFQRLQVKDFREIRSRSWLNLQDYQFMESLREPLDQQVTLYELSHHTRRSTLELSQLFHPLVKTGLIEVIPYAGVPQKPKPRIACIDDSKSIQRVVKMTLEASGFEVIGVTEPALSLSTFARQRPELILMDINMPEIDGYELCRLFNQSEMLRDIPVVMLTGRDGIIDRLRAKMVGASDYIAKPFNPQDLIRMVQSYVEQTSAQSTP
ncbi:response regulator [Picosynechococcus sp. PCC 73109]|uniref:response regulator n=1 Tax=Picosynechococcus sp. PCC 73109 TaxID=374982 RepID=UPI000745846C|nr:response regulator [Picosynechococcus sp. PCC 73109]AMA10155.1 regulator [Picosynechococcus sp. PCC 73109]